MVYNSVNAGYFDWLVESVTPYERNRGTKTYHRLMTSLFEANFRALINTDDARIDDAHSLRDSYARNFTNMTPADRNEFVNQGYADSCSVLELMVALAIRMEEHIMSDNEYGNRTSQWFWEMVSSLGLSGMDDHHFDEAFVVNTLERFVDRTFMKNGCGSLFTVNDPRIDMRNLDIWYQMHAYINTLMNGGSN